MKASVIVFPGSNCDRDIQVALEKFQIDTTMVWHQETSLPKSDLVVLPGGFSYGDYLRCGSMASKSKIMKSLLTCKRWWLCIWNMQWISNFNRNGLVARSSY